MEMDCPRVDSELTLSDLDNSLDTFPDTPLVKGSDVDADQSSLQGDGQTGGTKRHSSRVRPEKILSRVGSFADITNPVSLEELYEYDWADSDSESPSAKPKESYMVQELLADYLKVKSFKRKYPDLSRRVMDAYARSWLQQEGLVPVGRAELGLTALRTDEVMQLLQTDYPEVHEALSDLFRRRRFQRAAEQQKKQYEAARIERGEARAEAARRRALDSAAEFNHQLVKERLSNRRCYWDLQTMQIHFPQRRYKLLDPPSFPNGAYPVALIPGQFVDRFERYSAERLMRLPIGRCLYSSPARKHRDPPPLPTNLRFGSVQPPPAAPATFVVGGDGSDLNNSCGQSKTGNGRSSPPSGDRPPDSSTQIPSSADLGLNSEEPATTSESVQCAVCKQPADLFIRCAECGHTGHPKCLDISEAMLPGVQSYPWSCMECKRCVECSDPGDEDQMMFCDRCDRGYHAFCVGLEGIPDGQWECPLCTGEPVEPLKRKPTAGSKPGRGSKANTTTRPKKSKKYQDDDFEIKPKRRRKKKKKDVEEDKSTPVGSPDTINSESETPIKRKRGRPRLSSLDPPPAKRKYKPRSPKKTTQDANDPSLDQTSLTPTTEGEAACVASPTKCDENPASPVPPKDPEVPEDTPEGDAAPGSVEESVTQKEAK